MPWAFWAGVGGALAAAVISVKGILSSASSTAAIGFIFLPFVAIAAAVPSGIWGLAVGYLVACRRGLRQAVRPVLVMAWVVALAAPAMVSWEVYRGLSLERAVRALQPLDAQALEAALEHSTWNRNKLFLGALAQHHAAGPALLARIAAMPDPELHEAMGSAWDVMGANRKGLAVMRLVAAHPNTEPATLERLAASTSNEYVIHDILRNPKTPAKTMAPHLESTNYLVEWALALNPITPAAVLERLSRSQDRVVRQNLTWNAATPDAMLERLAKDADEYVARSATQVLDRRRAGAAKPG